MQANGNEHGKRWRFGLEFTIIAACINAALLLLLLLLCFSDAVVVAVGVTIRVNPNKAITLMQSQQQKAGLGIFTLTSRRQLFLVAAANHRNWKRKREKRFQGRQLIIGSSQQ